MKSSMRVYLWIFLFLFARPTIAQDASERYIGLDRLLGKDTFFDNHLTGFMLYDLDSQTVHYEKNSQIYFIPASTVKLFTFYAATMVLKDSTTLLRFVPKGDEVTIWGTGDPSWGYDKLPEPRIKDFFTPYKKINFSNSNWKDDAFGYGWQWDDYHFAYSAEKSPFPIHGNLVTAQNVNNRPVISPQHFRNQLSVSDRTMRNVQRDFHSNTFYYNPRSYNGQKAQVPFITSPQTFAVLAGQELNKEVMPSVERLPEQHFVLKGIRTEALYKEILQESDNFVAEQLMLMVSDEVFKELNTGKAIEFIQKNFLADLPDVPQWVDGSGLSRHNLASPRTMVALAEKIYRLYPDDILFNLFPKGGVNGTLKNNYKAAAPYVFAKTGTISNNHSLVGFIRTRSKKVYAFAFMNNNYPYKASQVRAQMEKVLLYIRDNY
jgi:D-alanyl-D-alanine carboxypeptidase/D-alanyl-D-alanine-endopeptidase (penicillin-binding protein 4)